MLVIPDVHLKPWMFEQASALMKAHGTDRAVCLMDLPDDWEKQLHIPLYEETFDAAVAFAKAWPKTRWCYGNHDLSYLWGRLQSGYSPYAEGAVLDGLRRLRLALPSELNLAYVHRIGNVLFSHGGVLEGFVKKHIGSRRMGDTDLVVDAINNFGSRIMWNDDSPIWARPQYSGETLYRAKSLLQVVGHTPLKEITQEGNLLSCDVFSTYRNGTPTGSRQFLLIDPETKHWEGVCSIKKNSL